MTVQEPQLRLTIFAVEWLARRCEIETDDGILPERIFAFDQTA
jgi:hypothetical protein